MGIQYIVVNLSRLRKKRVNLYQCHRRPLGKKLTLGPFFKSQHPLGYSITEISWRKEPTPPGALLLASFRGIWWWISTRFTSRLSLVGWLSIPTFVFCRCLYIYAVFPHPATSSPGEKRINMFPEYIYGLTLTYWAWAWRVRQPSFPSFPYSAPAYYIIKDEHKQLVIREILVHKSLPNPI